MSPGIYVDAPSWQQLSLMAVPPPAGQCTCSTAEMAQEWSDEPDYELKALNWPLNSSDPTPVDHLWDAPEPITIHVGAPMDGSRLMVHQMDVQLV